MEFNFPPDDIDDSGEMQDSQFSGFPLMPFLQAFRITPNGLIPLSKKSKLDKLQSHRKYLHSILNNSYNLYYVNEVKTGDNIKIYLECEQNKPGISIFDAYDYLSKTHYINFMLASLGIPVWVYEAINMQIHIDKYQKINIVVESSHHPEWISENMIANSYQSKYVNISTIIPNNPVTIQVMKAKSYISPISYYDMTFTFNSFSDISFDNIMMSSFYNKFIRDQIKDALYTYYPEYDKYPFNEYDEKLLRVGFDISFDRNLMSVKMVCTPALFYSSNNEVFYKYNYANQNFHLIGTSSLDNDVHDPIKLGEIVDFTNSISSSEVTQLITINCLPKGHLYQFCEECKSYLSHVAICTLDRNISNVDNAFSSFIKLLSSSEYIDSYWIPTEDILVDTESDDYFRIRGFINFNRDNIGIMSFSDIFQHIEKELMDNFNINKRSIKNESIKINRCYESENTCRVMLFNFVKKSKKHNNTERKSNNIFKRIFGR